MADKTLTTEEVISKKESLKGLIHAAAIPEKDDYIDDFDRGTVKFSPEMRNYSYHKVVIPDGTKILGINFSQVNPHTDAIQGEKLTFVECNLLNVEIHPSWNLVGCAEVHVKKEEVNENGKIFVVSSVEKDGVFSESAREEKI